MYQHASKAFIPARKQRVPGWISYRIGNMLAGTLCTSIPVANVNAVRQVEKAADSELRGGARSGVALCGQYSRLRFMRDGSNPADVQLWQAMEPHQRRAKHDDPWRCQCALASYCHCVAVKPSRRYLASELHGLPATTLSIIRAKA